ncbi:MAG: tRNA uridine-5-carboxymethylaminomethyl(34) synthesis GTPase MnmE [Proteobacteria bacterium]|nr:tRNA uridine-5-carboxymethylaminomethyl(34) synthesis GTPase MnmE [Pseudomonadota bacterium]
MPETIFALSSAPGRAGVAVIRVSGPGAGAALEGLTQKTLPPPRQAVLRLFLGLDGQPMDRGLLLWFAGPASFTGEDLAEIQVHGGRAVIESVLRALAAQPGLRPAEPGEFTRRAVENGKLDLTQAEAVIDLVDAETEAQRELALQQYRGTLFALYEGWRARLLRNLAWAEAAIDFSDEELPEDVVARVRQETSSLRGEIVHHLSDARRGEIVRDGLFLTVIGPPNAGKSSLINALAQRDVAIVAETAGTTRDVIEVRLDIGGYAVIVADTAGLREAADAIESEGVRRALARAQHSDLVLLLLDSSVDDPLAGLPVGTTGDLVVWNKADLPGPVEREGLRLSLKTGAGLDAVVSAIAAKVAQKLDRPRDVPILTRARHRHALEEALVALARAEAAGDAELFAEDLRLALRAIGRITGRVDVEDLLDVVFRDFCIGK